MHKSCAHPLNTTEGKLGGHGQHDSLAPPSSAWRRPRMKARWLAFKAPNLSTITTIPTTIVAFSHLGTTSWEDEDVAGVDVVRCTASVPMYHN